MFCFHKFGLVDERGLQYCSKCGKASAVHFQCIHQWKIVKESIITMYGLERTKLFLLKCKHCGEMKQFDYGLDDL